VLEHLFDDFEGNMNWVEDDEDNENNVNGTTVAQSDFSCDQFSDGHSLADEEEAYRRRHVSKPPLFTISHCE
jgi:hypothetical protein